VDPFGLNEPGDDAVGELTDEDLAGRRGLLEPRGRVDSVAGHESLPERGVAGDHLAGEDAGPVGQTDAPARLKVVVEPGHPLVDVPRRQDRSKRVVLPHRTEPEHGHDRVADVLFHRAAEPDDAASDVREVPVEDLAQGLGVEPLAERGRPD
jgi:hypothetical protein